MKQDLGEKEAQPANTVNGQNELLRILNGDAGAQLATLPDESVQMCCTSPPYWGLRNYGAEGQLGLETTPEAYVERLTGILREVKRVLRQDGTLTIPFHPFPTLGFGTV